MLVKVPGVVDGVGMEYGVGDKDADADGVGVVA
jgi:hypothetical protein